MVQAVVLGTQLYYAHSGTCISSDQVTDTASATPFIASSLGTVLELYAGRIISLRRRYNDLLLKRFYY